MNKKLQYLSLEIMNILNIWAEYTDFWVRSEKEQYNTGWDEKWLVFILCFPGRKTFYLRQEVQAVRL